MPKKPNINRQHNMVWCGNCYACICRVCNLKRCRQRTHLERCLYCQTMNITDKAILDCDYFESRYKVKVFRINRAALKRPTLHKMVYELWCRSMKK